MRTGIGVILICVGTCFAESDSFLPTVIISGIGCILVLPDVIRACHRPKLHARSKTHVNVFLTILAERMKKCKQI